MFHRQRRRRGKGPRVGERVAHLGNLPWFGMPGMEKVAEDKTGEADHSQIFNAPNLCSR